MNVLQPEIVKIGTRRYRKNAVQVNLGSDLSELRPYEEETNDMYAENRRYEDESCGLDCKPDEGVAAVSNDEEEGIRLNANGSYECVLIIAQSYIGYIIGRNGDRKVALERDTQTRIRTPNRGQGDWLAIEGKSKASVASCRNRILIMISTARFQKPFTHLLTFPVNFDGMKAKLKSFKSCVLDSCVNDRGIDDSIFQYESKLHLTICTLILLSEHEVDQAVSLLDKCRNTFIKDVLNSKPVVVSVRGLEYMNDDPSEVDVLYAKVEPVSDSSTNPIQTIADGLLNRFVEAGLSKRQFDRVKLHVTIMHSLLRQDTSGPEVEHSEEDKKRKSFDARNILAKFGDFDFGTYRLAEVHLSLRYSSGPDGYYKCISKIDL